MKDKSHRQRIEDELFYAYDPRVMKKFFKGCNYPFNRVLPGCSWIHRFDRNGL